MLDVDFLLSPKAQFKTHILHTYREACFKANVKALASDLAERNSWTWLDLESENQFDLTVWAPSLYGEIVMAIDLDVISGSPDPVGRLTSLESAMRDQKEKHFFLYGSPRELP